MMTTIVLLVYGGIALVCYPRFAAVVTWREVTRYYPNQEKPDGSDWFIFGIVGGALVTCLWPALTVLWIGSRIGRRIGINRPLSRFLQWYVSPPLKIRREQQRKRIEALEKDEEGMW